MPEPTQRQTPLPQPRSWKAPDGDDPSRQYWSLWRQGQQPGVEDFLAQARISDPEQIVTVLRVDQAERCRLGQWVPAETYLEAFPTVRDHAECAVDLVFAEYLLREEQGERPPLEEFQGRFPQYADELKLQIELHEAMEGDREPTAIWKGIPMTLPGERSAGPWARAATYPEIPGLEILGVLGHGGMGVVYKAWQTELKRLVAVKMLHAGAQASPQVMARFRVEAEAVARLRDSNIVQIYNVGQHGGAPYLVLELVEGCNLAQALAGTPLPTNRAAEQVEALARSIHSAHCQGVIHRDLSPANILLDAEGVPKITDFGLAKLMVGSGLPRTQTGDLMGTPSYMAPEQTGSMRREIGAATDVYALGAILYEMLTGRPPFKAELPIETLRQVIDDEPVSPSRLRPRLPRDLETICLKCLRKEPAQRYASAIALANDLRRFRDRMPILARRSTSAERFWRWCRRNPGLAAANITAATLTTILAIGATIAAWTFYYQRDRISLDNLRIVSAGREVRRNLVDALAAQAQARRFSRQAGQRFDSLDALKQAAAIARELKLPPERFDLLRDQAIACMALPDIKTTGRVITRPTRADLTAFDAGMTRYAFRFGDRVEVLRFSDDKELARFPARGDRGVFVFGFSPDGRYVATTHSPGLALTVWDIDQRRVSLNDPGPVPGYSARFSPDSRHIAVAHEDGEILIYELGTGQIMRRWRGPASVHDLAFAPDGTQIAVLNNETNSTTCRIVGAESGRLVRSVKLATSGGAVAWGPDGTTLATTSDDLKIYLWDAVTGSRRAILEGSTNAGLRAAFHPGGALLATNGWERRLRLWDTALGRPLLTLTGDSDLREFSQDGRVVIGLEDQLTTYRVDPALEYRTFAHVFKDPTQYQLASIRHDGRVLAVGTSRGAVLWDLARGAELTSLPIGLAWHLRFEPSGDLMTSGAIGVQRWPIRFDPGRGEFRIGPPRRLRLPVGRCAIDQDRSGRIVAEADHDFVSVLTPERTFQVGPLDDCRYVAVSPDGEWLATGSQSRGAQVWRMHGSTMVAELPIDRGTAVHFSPDGKWLMTAAAPCRLWAVGAWQEGPRIGGAGYGFSPDGRLVVVMDATKVIRLAETETGRTVARLESPDSCDVAWATFSPDGARLVVTTNDGPAVHVWDLSAIRRRLVEMGLDWNAPSYADDDDAADPSVRPLPKLEVDLGPLTGEVEHYTEPAETLVARYTERLKNHADDAEAYHHRGHALTQLRGFDQAIDDFTAAIRLRPDDEHFRIARAEILEFLKRYDPAIIDLEAVLVHTADRPDVMERLSTCCNNRAWELATGPEPTRDPDRALHLARRAVELTPDQSVALNTLGVALYRAGQNAEAILTLERSLTANRGEFAGFDLFFLAMAHYRLGRRAIARDCHDRAVSWVETQKRLSAEQAKELARFRAEAEAVLSAAGGTPPT